MGKGSYFARDAAYSHHYSKSDTHVQMMFLARVLVGDFVRGNPSLVRPPAKEGQSNAFYDSCVNSVSDPGSLWSLRSTRPTLSTSFSTRPPPSCHLQLPPPPPPPPPPPRGALWSWQHWAPSLVAGSKCSQEAGKLCGVVLEKTFNELCLMWLLGEAAFLLLCQ